MCMNINRGEATVLSFTVTFMDIWINKHLVQSVVEQTIFFITKYLYLFYFTTTFLVLKFREYFVMRKINSVFVLKVINI